MAVLIDNDVQDRVLEMRGVVPAIEDAFTQLGRGDAAFLPRRTEILSPTAKDLSEKEAETFFLWAGLRGALRDPPRFAFRFRSDIQYLQESGGSVTREKFNVEPGRFMGFVLLFDTSNGELIGLMNDGILQHHRVGATAGVACKYLSREDSSVVAMLGSGGMARSYAAAFNEVRDLDVMKVYSPTPENREAYAEEMTDELGIDVTPVDSADEAVRSADIVSTCTDSLNPVHRSEWVEPGRFFTNCTHAEVPVDMPEAVDSTFITTNHGAEEADVVGPESLRDHHLQQGYRRENEDYDYPTLGEVLVGDSPGRTADDESILYFCRSCGIQFPAISNLIYEKAVEHGLGTEVPLEWFQQTIRD